MPINDYSKLENLYVLHTYKEPFRLKSEVKSSSNTAQEESQNISSLSSFLTQARLRYDNLTLKTTLAQQSKKTAYIRYFLTRLTSNITNALESLVLKKFSCSEVSKDSSFYFTVKIGSDVAFIGKKDDSFYLYGLEGKGKNLFELSVILKIFNIQNFNFKSPKD